MFKYLGTASDQSCKKISCGFELLNIENILKRNAPVYFEKVDGCPINWYDCKLKISALFTIFDDIIKVPIFQLNTMLVLLKKVFPTNPVAMSASMGILVSHWVKNYELEKLRIQIRTKQYVHVIRLLW